MNLTLTSTRLLKDLPPVNSNQMFSEFPVWHITMLCLACVLTTVPNSALLAILFKMKSLRKQAANHLIASFTFSDLITGAILFPLGIIHEIEYVQRHHHEKTSSLNNGSHSVIVSIEEVELLNTTNFFHHEGDFHYQNDLKNNDLNMIQGVLDEPQRSSVDEIGEGFCDLLQAAVNLLGYASIWHMALIAIDRYYRITSPITYKRWMTKRKAIVACIMIWIISSVLTFFLFWSYKKSGIPYESSQCVIYITTNYYVFAFAISIGIIPMLMMIYYYVKLIRLSQYSFKSSSPLEVHFPRRTEQMITQQCIPMTAMPITCFTRRPNSSSSDSEEFEEIDPDIRNNRSEAEMIEIRARKKRVRRSKRAAILVGFIIGGHFVLVIPGSLVYMLYTFWPKLQIDQTIFIYLYPWMTFFNSAYNPWIYFFLTKDLRNAVVLWFRKKFRCLRSHV